MRTIFQLLLLAAALLCGGCGDKLLGKYTVADMDKTLAGITDLPAGFSNQMTLAEYRGHIRKEYADKVLELTAQPPHTFVVPVPLEGSVHGLFDGGWMRDTQNQSTILIYRWVSGSVYVLWGRGALTNGVLTVNTVDTPVLYFTKR